jgi:hypothetical protein
MAARAVHAVPIQSKSESRSSFRWTMPAYRGITAMQVHIATQSTPNTPATPRAFDSIGINCNTTAPKSNWHIK